MNESVIIGDFEAEWSQKSKTEGDFGIKLSQGGKQF